MAGQPAVPSPAGTTPAPATSAHRSTWFRQLFETNTAVKLIIDPDDGRIVDANLAACEYYGYDKPTLLSLNIGDINTLAGEDVRAEMERARSETRLYFNFRHRLASGEVRDVEVYSGPIRMGKKVLLYSIIHDITQRKQAEAALQQSEERYRTLFETMAQGAIYQDADGRITEANPAAARILGLSRVEMLGLSPLDPRWRLTHGDGRPWPGAEIPSMEALRTGQPVLNRTMGVFNAVLGADVWISISSIPLFRPGGVAPYQVYSTFEDITRRKEAELTLARTQEQLRLALDASGAGLWDWDIATDRLTLSANWSRITGHAAPEPGTQGMAAMIGCCHPDDLAAARKAMDRHLGGESVQYESELRLRHKDGRWVWVELQGRVVERDEDGTARRMSGTVQDISARKVQEQHLSEIAHHDALTHLPNRFLLADRMQQALAHSQRSASMMAVCMLDLDGFKPVNDRFGHKAGDQILVEVARRLQECIRAGDTVARLGGDEFVILLGNLAQTQECEQALSRVLVALANPYTVAGQPVSVTASIGVTLYPGDGADADTLLRHADNAMYTAKQKGKNRYHLFDPAFELREAENREALHRIRQGLASGQFQLYYQPKVNCRLGRVVGAEALIRWRHPVLGHLSPSEFLPLVEQTELADGIGEWVIREALARMRAWRQCGIDLPVSVNIFGRHLHSAGFADRLLEIMAEFPDTPPGRLEIEIVETAALQDVDTVAKLVERCGRHGVGFSLDDFGTGYSSLTYLRRLRVQALKIDQSFVSDMLQDIDDLTIVDGIISLATAFHSEVVAEGVEDRDQAALLMEMGCDVMQGFAFARPMPAEAVPDWIRDYRPAPLRNANGIIRLCRDDIQLRQVEMAHRQWVDRLMHWCGGDATIPPTLDVETDRECRFGQWYHGEGSANYGGYPEFRELEPFHVHIHELAERLVAASRAGLEDESASLRARLLEEREQLLAALQRLKLAIIQDLVNQARHAADLGQAAEGKHGGT